MSGEVLAILAALFYAIHHVILRRVVMKLTNATLGIYISVPLSIPLYLLIMLTMGQVGTITSFGWQNYLWLSANGILSYIIGRGLFYFGVQRVGANITSALTRIAPVIVLILGVTILNELLSLRLVAGVLLVVFGVIIIGLHPDIYRGNIKLASGISVKGILFGLCTGISWGIGAIFIKLGLEGSNYPIVGAFISFSAATIGLSISLFRSELRNALFNMGAKTALLFCLPSLFLCGSNLLRFIALSMSPASVVIPLISTLPVMTIVLSFIVNRKLDVFNVNIILGAILVVVGSILIV
jgi:DME family drug/metabolite transporter